MRPLERWARVEAAEHLKRGLAHIDRLPRKPAHRLEDIKLQVALINVDRPHP